MRSLPNDLPQDSGAASGAHDVMDIEGAAAYLKVSRDWLHRSDIPRARLGRRIVFLRSELLTYVTAHLTHRVRETAL